MRKLGLLFALLASTTCLVSCGENPNPNPPTPPPGPTEILVESISFALSKTQIKIGETSEIKDLVINPSNATKKVVSFKSSNSDVAKIDGLTIVPLKIGETNIIGTVDNQPTITYSVKLEVVPIHVESVELALSKTEIEVGESTLATVKVLPENATNKKYTYSFNPSGIVSLENDTITGLKKGYVYINAISEDGYISSSNILLKVNNVTAKEIKLSCGKTTLAKNETINLSYTIEPNDVVDQEVAFKTESGKTNVIAVSNEGFVTATGVGTDSVIAYMKNKPEVSSKLSFTVVDVVATGINASIDKNKIEIDETAQITYKVLPTDAADKRVSFRTKSGNNIIRVSNTGLITGVSAGKETVVCYLTGNPSIYKELEIEVTAKHVKQVNLVLSKSSIEIGESVIGSVEVLPVDAGNKKYSYVASPADAVSISGNTITALKKGNVYIYVVAEDGNVESNKVLLTINDISAKSIELDCIKTSLYVNEIVVLTYNVLPAEAVDTEVAFKTESGNENVISVSSSGIVTAKGIGQDSVIAYMKNKPEVFAKLLIKVVQTPATGLNASVSKTSIKVGETSQITYEVLPSDASDKSVSFKTKSGNNNTVSVSNDGLITGKGIGKDTVICYLTGNPSITKEFEIEVVATPVTDISVEKTSVNLQVNDSYQIKANVLPDSATDKSISYELLDRNDYSDKGTRFESATDYTYDLPEALVLNEVITIDVCFDESANKDKISVMFGQGWQQYFGYYTLYNDGTLGDNYTGVSVTEITKGMFRFSFDLSLLNKAADKPLPDDYVDMIYLRGGWSTASGSIKINREIKEDILTVSSTGLVTANKLGEQKVRVYSVSNPSIYEDVTFNVTSNPVDPIGDDVYDEF